VDTNATVATALGPPAENRPPAPHATALSSGVGKWTPEEDRVLSAAVSKFGAKNWKHISEFVPNRNHTQCLQRWGKVLDPDLVKGHWASEEDTRLVDLVKELAIEGIVENWGEVANMITGRTSKQCRERWFNHLDPSIKRGNYTAEEDTLILEQQVQLGNRWSIISAMLPGRTEDAVKTRWKKMKRERAQGTNQTHTVHVQNGFSSLPAFPISESAEQMINSQMGAVHTPPAPQATALSNSNSTTAFGTYNTYSAAFSKVIDETDL
jgi:myb proto-oncogene protein